MSVQTYTPGDVRVTMTEKAATQARKEIARQGVAGLRLSVRESGCSGFMYVLDYASSDSQDDQRVQTKEGVTLFIDKKSAPILNGTEIDYVTEGVNSFFKFRNPNATGECGCGESFTVNH